MAYDAAREWLTMLLGNRLFLMCTEWLTMLLGYAGMVFDETRLYGMVFDEGRLPGMMSDRRNVWHAGQALSLSKQAQACSEGAET